MLPEETHVLCENDFFNFKLGKSVPPNWNLFYLAYLHHFQACFLLHKRGPIACEKQPVGTGPKKARAAWTDRPPMDNANSKRLAYFLEMKGFL